MTGQAFPLFFSGRLLRQEMLESIADYAFQFGELLHTGYSDGILSGCRLTATPEKVYLNPGILCHDGRLYLVKRPLSIAYKPTNTTRVLKIKFAEPRQTENFIYRDMDLVLEEDAEPRISELELCRFKLQPGAVLRHQYVDFEDRSTEYDTLNTIRAPFAAQGQGTLSPYIVQAYARELMQAGCNESVDAAFCIQSLGAEKPLAVESIAAYLSFRVGFQRDEGKNINEQLYEGLLKLLKGVKQGNVQKGGRSQAPRRKILVD